MYNLFFLHRVTTEVQLELEGKRRGEEDEGERRLESWITIPSSTKFTVYGAIRTLMELLPSELEVDSSLL